MSQLQTLVVIELHHDTRLGVAVNLRNYLKRHTKQEISSKVGVENRFNMYCRILKGKQQLNNVKRTYPKS